MKELKFKPTNKTVDFFNEFSVIDNLSIEIMLNRVLCCAINKVPFDAAIILLWYVIVCIDNLDNRQQNELIFSLIFQKSSRFSHRITPPFLFFLYRKPLPSRRAHSARVSGIPKPAPAFPYTLPG